MAPFNSPLDRVRIASPCKADWEEMVGTDRVRFCGQCNLNVYNLSSMTRPDAESFISRNEGRLCVRFYRRSDGSILTRNCPVGLRAIRKRMSYIAKAVTSTALGFFAGLGLYEGLFGTVSPEEGISTGVMLRVEPPRETTTVITPVADEPSPPQVSEVKGKIAVEVPSRTWNTGEAFIGDLKSSYPSHSYRKKGHALYGLTRSGASYR